MQSTIARLPKPERSTPTFGKYLLLYLHFVFRSAWSTLEWWTTPAGIVSGIILWVGRGRLSQEAQDVTNWVGVVVVPVLVAALTVLVRGVVAPYCLWKEARLERDALQHKLAKIQDVRQFQDDFAGFKKTGSMLWSKVGPIGATKTNHFAPELPAQTDKWIEEVTAFLMREFGPMAVVDFENENYHSSTSNPNAHFSLFVRIHRHVSGLDIVINKWRSYQRL